MHVLYQQTLQEMATRKIWGFQLKWLGALACNKQHVSFNEKTESPSSHAILYILAEVTTKQYSEI